MKQNTKLLFICIAIPMVIGGVSAFLAQNGMESFADMNKPPLSPPTWLFPIVWTILYILMGISSYLILTSEAEESEIRSALRLYGYQLMVNFLWPTFFFNFGWYGFSFLWLLLLWGLVLFMILYFKNLSNWAAYLNIPYLLWLTFAGYLNLFIWILNR